MVNFGPGHVCDVALAKAKGRSDFATAGVARLRRGLQRSENAGMGRKVPFMDGH